MSTELLSFEAAYRYALSSGVAVQITTAMEAYLTGIESAARGAKKVGSDVSTALGSVPAALTVGARTTRNLALSVVFGAVVVAVLVRRLT